MHRKPLRIIIEEIPHNDQRYETVGDWLYDKKTNTYTIKASHMHDERYVFLVASHEMHEAYICTNEGVSQDDVDRFDTEFEMDRAKGYHTASEEPGNSIMAPYGQAHRWVTKRIEKPLSKILGVVWKQYNQAVVSLHQ